MKKLLTILVTLLMLFSVTACSSGNGGGQQEADGPSVITIDMSTLFIVPALEATQKVEDQINDYLLNTLGEKDYKIKLRITAIGDYLTSIPMELAAGGDGSVDIVQVFDVANWSDNGYIIPLDPYLENELKPTYDMIKPIMGSGRVGGQTFMMPRYFGTVLDWKWIYN
ncbi:MAG: extracellular solute-binding protein, partial [Erysipelotrichaceae bacterium]|nr:extracellular solute-binding protein [Erysipelotrichaceae bacterium]